jgi:NADH-quinone oxidoreductase subunit H
VTLILIVLGKSIITATLLLSAFGLMTWIERKVLARFQFRPGPNRLGPAGVMQFMADGLKLALKEEIIPAAADRRIYLLAPFISLTAALVAFAVIPWGPPIHIFGQAVPMQIAAPNIGILFVFAVTSLGVYGLILGGWASANKYSLLGGLRSTAQIISYELAMGLAVTGVLIAAGSTDLNTIVQRQYRLWFVVPQIVGFLIYIVTMVAETNRTPFDLPEAENELVAGYHTEYTGLKWAMYMMAEYINMITVSAVATTLFLGGWHGPWLPPELWFLLKVALFLYFFIWLRATLPRLRYDRLMAFGWKVLLPVALLNTLATAVWVALSA